MKSESESSGDDDESEENEEEQDSDDEVGEGVPREKKDWPKTGHDVGENKTVFVRNLGFESEESDLKAMLEENFGRVLFARMVIDKATGHPKVEKSMNSYKSEIESRISILLSNCATY